jgi:hypothetical protein
LTIGRLFSATRTKLGVHHAGRGQYDVPLLPFRIGVARADSAVVRRVPAEEEKVREA